MEAFLIYIFLIFSQQVYSQECACPSQKLDNSNIKDFIDPTSPFYKKIVSSNLVPPVYTKNGCSGWMHCEDADDLLIFDSTGLGKLFGAQSANGTCDASTQTWNVDTGSGSSDLTSFEELWGTCLVDGNPFYTVLTTSEIISPSLTVSGCSATMSCASGYSLLLFDDTGLGKTFDGDSAIGQCDSKSRKWKVDTGSRIRLTPFNQMYGVCIANDDSNSNSTTNSNTATSTDPSATTPSDEEPDLCATQYAPPTLYYAFSNDLDQKVVLDTWKQIETNSLPYINFFVRYGITRFDVRNVEKLAMVATAKAAYIVLANVLPDPSLGFTNSSTGSNILQIIKNFITSTNPLLCNSKIVILLKRFPDEEDITELASLLRKQRAFLYIIGSMTPSRGRSFQTMYDLATRANGLALLEKDENFAKAVLYRGAYLPFDSFLVYTSNPQVSGRRNTTLPYFDGGPQAGQYLIVLTLQDHAPLDTFEWMRLYVDRTPNYFVSITKKDITSLRDRNYFSFQRYFSGGRDIRLEYSYSDNTPQTLQFRIFFQGYHHIPE